MVPRTKPMKARCRDLLVGGARDDRESCARALVLACPTRPKTMARIEHVKPTNGFNHSKGMIMMARDAIPAPSEYSQ
jgi:hypothetical protein